FLVLRRSLLRWSLLRGVCGRLVLRGSASPAPAGAGPGDAVAPSQLRNLPADGFGDLLRRIGATVGLPVGRNQLGMVLGEPGQELLLDAGPQVQGEGRDMGGTRLGRRLDRR